MYVCRNWITRWTIRRLHRLGVQSALWELEVKSWRTDAWARTAHLPMLCCSETVKWRSSGTVYGQVSQSPFRCSDWIKLQFAAAEHKQTG